MDAVACVLLCLPMNGRAACEHPRRATLDILRVLRVPKIVSSAHNRYVQEVVDGWRRRDAPFECARIPWVRTCLFTAPASAHDIDQEDQRRQRDRKSASGGYQVPRIPPHALRIGMSSAWLSLQPEYVHGGKRKIETDEHQQEMKFPEPLGEKPAEELRPPVVEAREQAEDRASEQHVVEVRNYVVGIGLLLVVRHQCVRHSRKAADHEHRNETNGKQERGRDSDGTTP